MYEGPLAKIYTANKRKERYVEKYIHSTVYNVVADFIRIAVVASEICEILCKFELIYSSRSSKVIDLGINRKRICNFLLVINSNFERIFNCFRDIDA